MGTKHTTWAAPVTYGASKFKVMTDELHARPVAVVNTLEDARLIAAAPETTSALAAALDDLEAALPALRNAGWQTHNEEATIRRGRAVLEKATGASNGN